MLRTNFTQIKPDNMKQLQRERAAKLLLIFVTLLTGVQTSITLIPGMGPHTQTLVSAIVLYLVSIMTLLRQHASNEISNQSTVPTWIIIAIATIGGLNDIFNLVHFSEFVDQCIRFGITFSTFMLNLLSKVLYPTLQTNKTSNP